MEHATALEEDQLDSDFLPGGTSLLNGQYVIERYLSSGGFGITYLARDSLERPVVIKECFPEAFCSRKNRTVVARSRSQRDEFQSFVDMFVREARSIAKLDHPNIVGVHQVFHDNETAYMALDLIEGKDLLNVIENSVEMPAYPKVKANLLKLLDAISTVHAEDMLHRDISPDNILIDTWENPVLIDFGAAREEASKKSRALSAVLVVKDGYSPQEFYISGSKQGPSSDLYALAATFYHLISGEMPPDSQARLAAIASRKADIYQPLVGRIEEYPDDFLAAIDTCMNVFPQDRLQSAQDWIVRIDASKRTELALQRAKSDQNIEKTVSALVEAAMREPAPAPKPAKKKVADVEQVTRVSPSPPSPPVQNDIYEDLYDITEEDEDEAWEEVIRPQAYRPLVEEQPKRFLKFMQQPDPDPEIEHLPEASERKPSLVTLRNVACFVLAALFGVFLLAGPARPLAEGLGFFILEAVTGTQVPMPDVG